MTVYKDNDMYVYSYITLVKYLNNFESQQRYVYLRASYCVYKLYYYIVLSYNSRNTRYKFISTL